MCNLKTTWHIDEDKIREGYLKIVVPIVGKGTMFCNIDINETKAQLLSADDMVDDNNYIEKMQKAYNKCNEKENSNKIFQVLKGYAAVFTEELQRASIHQLSEESTVRVAITMTLDRIN